MHQTIISKALSLTLAASLCLGGLPMLQTQLTASAAAESQSGESTQQSPVTVIVKVSGDAVLAQPAAEELGVSYLNTAQADRAESRIRSAQERVQQSIRALYPELEIQYSYSILLNAFCCEIPADLIPEIRALPGVEQVAEVHNCAAPQMARAAQLGGFPAYYDTTGCTGEGQVIAIIDSELDITHPMFAPLDESIETKLTQESIADIVQNVGLNAQIDPSQTYINSKLPFVADYYDADPYADVPDPDSYHGTHVTGIAAGNAITDDNGEVISGVAKDAQILFMATGNENGDISYPAAIAATEDAVRLRADVINMSFGSPSETFGNNLMGEALKTAENAGIMVCIAAGNFENGVQLYGAPPLACNPDGSTIEDKADPGASLLVVASAENEVTEYLTAFGFKDQLIVYRPTLHPDTSMLSLGDDLQEGDYAYEFCGDGTPEDFEGKDLTGKLALVNRADDDDKYTDIANCALAAGAVGVIVMDWEITDGLSFVISESELPLGVITYEDGQMLLAEPEQTLSFRGQTVPFDYPTEVSMYTAYGGRQSLDLRPDIMGIGGCVESAGYGSTEQIMSGTSMASPYLAGCAAIMNEYMQKQGIALNGRDKLEYMRNLLMCSAVPYTDENGLYVTPRRQGAGLVSMNNMLADKVILTGPEGAAKVNLYDKLGSSFRFQVDLSNLSNEDVSFSSAKLALTTDGTIFDETTAQDRISGQQALISSADCSALLNIAAGESRTETVSVTLDAAQYEALRETFTNGFFIEGYLLLEGADNCCDISIPLLGFSDDWAQLPIFEREACVPSMKMGNMTIEAGHSLTKALAHFTEIARNIPEDSYDTEDDFMLCVQMAATPDEYEEMFGNADTVYVSPNNDGLADHAGIIAKNIRQYLLDGAYVEDAEGNRVMEGQNVPVAGRWYVFSAEPNDEMNSIPDGTYNLVLSGSIDYEGSAEHPQTISYPLVVDTQAPQLETQVSEKDGRTILTLTASDETALDGIIVTGHGQGGTVGAYDPDADYSDSAYNLYEITRYICRRITDATILDRPYNESTLPLAGRAIMNQLIPGEENNINFCDIIPADPDEDGSFTLTYDITDFSEYSFTVLDRALNTAVFETEPKGIEKLEDSLWYSKNSLIEINGDRIRFASFVDGSIEEGTFTLTDGTLAVTAEDGTVTKYKTAQIGYNIRLNAEDGNAELLIRIYETTALEEFPFFTVRQFIDKLSAQFTEQYGMEIADADYTIRDPYSVMITLYVDMDGNPVPCAIYDANLIEGTAMDPDYNLTEPFAVPLTELKPGTYSGLGILDINYFVFNEDNTGSLFSQKGDPTVSFRYDYDGEGTLTLYYEDGTEKTALAYLTGKGELKLTWQDEDGLTVLLNLISEEPFTEDSFLSNPELMELGTRYELATTGKQQEAEDIIFDTNQHTIIIFPDGDSLYIDQFTGKGEDVYERPVDLNNLPVMPKNAYSFDELCEMASKDYEKRTGIKPDSVNARLSADGKVIIELTDEDHNPLDTYTVDPVSGKGTNSADEKIDLPQTGNNAPASAAMAAAAVLLMMTGAVLTGKSGIFRRKEETTEE